MLFAPIRPHSLSIEDRILALSDADVEQQIPMLLRAHGYAEDEIKRALAAIWEFRKQHRESVIS